MGQSTCQVSPTRGHDGAGRGEPDVDRRVRGVVGEPPQFALGELGAIDDLVNRAQRADEDRASGNCGYRARRPRLVSNWSVRPWINAFVSR